MAVKMMVSFATWTMTRPPARFATISSSRSWAGVGSADARKNKQRKSTSCRNRTGTVACVAHIGKGLNIPAQILRGFWGFFTGNQTLVDHRRPVWIRLFLLLQLSQRFDRIFVLRVQSKAFFVVLNGKFFLSRPHVTLSEARIGIR